MGQMKIDNGKINFRCRMDHCDHSCCGPFEGISGELSNLDNRPFKEIVLTLEDYERLYQSGHADLIEEDISPATGKRYYKMALMPDGTCKALINGRCSIHNISPTLCKAFPFYFDMFSGLCAINCDGFDEDRWADLQEFEPYFENARKMYAFWLDFYKK